MKELFDLEDFYMPIAGLESTLEFIQHMVDKNLQGGGR